MTTAVFSKRNPTGLWLTSQENALMTVMALCFSWDMCSVLHDWVWAGQSNRIPIDLGFGFFSWFVFPFTRISDTSWVGTHTSGFANVTSKESPLAKKLCECERQKKVVSWACHVFARPGHTNRWGNVCMVSEETLSLFNLNRGKTSLGWAKFRQKPAGRHRYAIDINTLSDMLPSWSFRSRERSTLHHVKDPPVS